MPHAKPAPLAGWYVISLRPQARHAPVRRAAAARGASVFALSTTRLEPLDAGPALARALAASCVIVTSPAAAAFAAAQTPLRVRRGQRWIAVGTGTAAALQRAGVAAARIPATATSEGVLALPELRAVRGRTIGLVTAPGGRDLIAPGLRRLGAIVVTAPVYRRVPVTPRAHRLAALGALPAARSALLVSSGEALAQLWQVLDVRQQQRLGRMACVVSSPRLDAQAQALGFRHRVLASGARPGALLDALAAHVAGPPARRFR